LKFSSILILIHSMRTKYSLWLRDKIQGKVVAISTMHEHVKRRLQVCVCDLSLAFSHRTYLSISTLTFLYKIQVLTILSGIGSYLFNLFLDSKTQILF
jgi:hypothetical protein